MSRMYVPLIFPEYSENMPIPSRVPATGWFTLFSIQEPSNGISFKNLCMDHHIRHAKKYRKSRSQVRKYRFDLKIPHSTFCFVYSTLHFIHECHLLSVNQNFRLHPFDQ